MAGNGAAVSGREIVRQAMAVKEASKRKALAEPKIVTIPPLRTASYWVTVVGLTPLVVNQKTVENIASRKVGGKVKPTDQEKFDTALYKMSGGRFGFKARAFKRGFLEMSKELGKHYHGISGAWAAKAINIIPEEGELVQIIGPKPEVYVTTGCNPNQRGCAVRIVRPMFKKWAIKFMLTICDVNTVASETVFTILSHAGQRVGIGEDRPERGAGTFGTYKIEKVVPA